VLEHPKPPKAKLIGVIGVPGTGKSTIAQALQVDMGSTDLATAVCPEYAREWINRVGPPEHVAFQQQILFKQKRREDTLSESCDVLFCDSPLFHCYIYGMLIANTGSLQEMKVVRNLYKWAVLDNLNRYDALIYLPKQFETVDDGCRDPEASDTIESVMLGFLNLHKPLFKNFIEIRSEETDPQEILKDRVKQAKKEIRKLL